MIYPSQMRLEVVQNEQFLGHINIHKYLAKWHIQPCKVVIWRFIVSAKEFQLG